MSVTIVIAFIIIFGIGAGTILWWVGIVIELMIKWIVEYVKRDEESEVLDEYPVKRARPLHHYSQKKKRRK